MNILQACDDPKLFAPWFRRGDWRAWRVFLAALFGLRMDAKARRIYTTCTGRATPPSAQAAEAWLVVGRRGGKSFIVSLVAVFLACFRDYRAHFAPGERGVVMVLAADRRQARVILRYVRALLRGVAMLNAMVVAERAEAIELANGIDIEIHTGSFRAVRGYTVVAALLDELAFWHSDEGSANPDAEIVAALRPALATVPNSMLLGLSSPYAMRGVLWDAHRRYYGHDAAPVLVWQAPSRTMNPTLPQRVVDEAYERDPISAAAEYGAQFRSDVESFIPRDAVEACTPSVAELLPAAGVRYVAFVDPSGGSADAMTLAIAHKDGDGRAVLDAVRVRKPPFSPEAVVAEFAALLKSYRVAAVTGDRYAGEWPRERFRVHGVAYQPADRTRSELYVELLPLLNSRTAVLLRNPMLLTQLCALERRTSRTGKDTIDHAPGAHDDLANAVAGALVMLQRPVARPSIHTFNEPGYPVALHAVQ